MKFQLKKKIGKYSPIHFSRKEYKIYPYTKYKYEISKVTKFSRIDLMELKKQIIRGEKSEKLIKILRKNLTCFRNFLKCVNAVMFTLSIWFVKIRISKMKTGIK